MNTRHATKMLRDSDTSNKKKIITITRFHAQIKSIRQRIIVQTLGKKTSRANEESLRANDIQNSPFARWRASSSTLALVCLTTIVSNRASSTRERRLAGYPF